MLAPRREDLREMLALAGPIVIVQLGMMAMAVVDTIMVGHVSPIALAATGIGNLYFHGFSFLGNGTLMSLDPLVAQAVGAHDDRAIGRAVQRGLVLALGLTVFTTLGFLPAAAVFRLLAQPADVIPDAARFVLWSIPGLLPWFAFMVLRQSLQALGKIAPLVVVVIVANASNVALNWVLIYGNLGAPPLGVTGSAIATSVSRWVLALGVLAMAWPTLRRHLAFRVDEMFDRVALSRMVIIGLPIGGQYLLEYATFALTGLMMGWLGTVPVAAHQIALNLAALTFMVPLGVSAAAAVLVGRAVGRDDPDAARRFATTALGLGAGFMVISAGALLAIPGALASVYTNDDAVRALAMALIPIAGVFQLFDGAQVVCIGVLRGIADTRAPLVINVLGFWLIGVPVGAWLAFGLGMGPVGLWWGLVAGLSVVAVMLVARMASRMRRTIARLAIDAPSSVTSSL
jgi:multidrug resistance protein, MATE family